MQATAKEAKLPSIKKGKKNFSVFPFVNGLFFLLFCLFILVPLWKVLVDSLDLTTGYGMKLWPENFGLAGYQSVFSNPMPVCGYVAMEFCLTVESPAQNIVVISFTLFSKNGRSRTKLPRAAKKSCVILFPNENAPRCSANFSLWLTGVKCSVAALR